MALFGALVTNALPKLLAMMEKNKGHPSPLRENVRSIHENLGLIQAAIRTINVSSIGRNVTELQAVGIAQLGRLAADIEDCIDCFHIGKMSPKDFSRKIEQLKGRTKEKHEELQRSIKTANEITAGPATSSATHPAVGAAASAAVPRQLQVLLGNTTGSMPSNLNCLLYFCMFPCDHHVERNSLIRRWLAEGLVIAERDDRSSLQDVAARYLETLITNKIILPIKESNNGKVKRSETPEEILEYISRQSRSTNFMTFYGDREEGMGYIRRLSVRPNSAAGNGVLNVPHEFCYVRTLAVFPAEEPGNYDDVLDFPKYEVLRLLDLKECAHVGDDHLRAICDLLMLKYLSLGSSIVRVPRRVEKLKMLETVDLGKTVVVTVYSEILELPYLRHLLGKLHLCTDDIWLWRKDNLRKFLSKDSRLETLSGFVTGKSKGFIKLMRHMKRLKKVKIWCDSATDKANLKKLRQCIEIFIGEGVGRSLCIDFQESSGQFLESLQAPGSRPSPGSIASLKLRGKLPKFPDFIGQMTGIKQVCLSMTNLSGDEIIGGLSTLTILEYLKLVEQNLEPLVIRPAQFPILKRICLVGVTSLGIEIKAMALPALVSLHLICETLGAHPGTPSVEIMHMAELKEIGLHSALSLNAVIRGRWEAAAGGHPNTPKPLVSFITCP